MKQGLLGALSAMKEHKHIGRPQFTLADAFQNYRAQTIEGSTTRLNHPLLTIEWQNFITLPKGFTLMPSLGYCSKGDQGNMRINDPAYSMALSVRKSFLKDRLLVTLNASNPFEWADTDVTLFGAREMRTDKHNPRSFYAHVVYRFNTAQSKYKGRGNGHRGRARRHRILCQGDLSLWPTQYMRIARLLAFVLWLFLIGT